MLAACGYSFSFIDFRRAMVAIFPDGPPSNETDVTIYVSGSLEIPISLQRNLLCMLVLL